MKTRVKIVTRSLNPRTLLPKSPVAAVRAVWILAVLWYELGTFYWDLAGCRWPDAELDLGLKDKEASSSASPTHVLLITDPQIRAPRRHSAWKRWLHITDIALRKRWSFVRSVHPDVVVFLGDMLDRGRYADDDEGMAVMKENFQVEGIILDSLSIHSHKMDNGHIRITRNATPATLQFFTAQGFSSTGPGLVILPMLVTKVEATEYRKRASKVARVPHISRMYRESFEYFKSIFPVEPNTKVYYVPGNHDVGLGPSSRMNTAYARRRFTRYFGPLNNRVNIANHTLFMLDASGLVEEDYRRANTGKSFEEWQAIPDGAVDFINKFAGVGSEEPVVLLSHIPLFRPDTAGCGPLRERGNIRRGVGPGFQNMLMRDTTKYILRYVRPAVVFSGNDHDYCEYTHSIPLLSEGPEAKIDYVREVTVKAIVSAGDIRRPGLQLLSLSGTFDHQTDGKTFTDAPCFLPSEQDIYLGRYLPLLVLSLLVLLAAAIKRHRSTRRRDLDTSASNETLPLSASHNDFDDKYLDSASLHHTGRTTGTSTLAPTLRSSANGQYVPHTPDFSVGGDVPREFQFSAQTGLGHSGSEGEGDEEDFQVPEQMARYRDASGRGNDYLRLTLDRARRKRRFAWTWTFELGGRRRRLVIGVPFLMEHLVRTFWRATTSYLGGNRSAKDSILVDFLSSVLVAGWPSIVLLCITNYFLL